MASKPQFYRAKEGFVTQFRGEQIGVAAGELVIAGHPLLKGRAELFEPATSLGRFTERPEVEQATAEPGEKRGEKKETRAKATKK
jgi:hypothetical protein